MKPHVWILAGLLMLGAGGCSGDDEPSAGSDKCSDIWVAGKVLPKGYEGCTGDDGEPVAVPVYGDCTDGTEFVGYTPENGESYFAGLGGEIFKVSMDDPQWHAKLAECRGE